MKSSVVSTQRLVLLAVVCSMICPAVAAPQELTSPSVVVQVVGEAEAAPRKEQAAKESEGDETKTEGDKEGQGEKPGKEEDKNKDKDKDKEKAEAEESVKRPTTPAEPPNRDELKAKPDEHGRVRFYFHGQKWQDFLEWLAEAGGYTLDWEELPAGYISIATRRYYAIDEARDMVNRLLLERGYTSVLQREVLSVLKLKSLDPSLIPIAEDDELLDLQPFTFAKVTFQLPDDLQAGKFSEDVKLLLSPYGKVQALVATNRLRVMDAVINLREVSDVVNGEHAALIGKTAPSEFKIKFVRADYVADQVMIILGLDPSSRRNPQELQVEQQRLQLFMQMQQKGKDITKYLRKGETPQVFLAVNKRQNTLIANAPEKELKIIARTVQLLDVPGDSDDVPNNLTNSAARMEKYQLVTISPQSIVTALEQIGELDPKTQLKIDSDAKVVFAFATENDHVKIRTVIDNLDGTGRQFEVIRLRSLPAKAVATSIRNLMVGEEKEDNNRGYSWRWYEEEQQKPNEGFRIDADVENNRLILWANEAEIAEVHDLLTKLDERPSQRSNPSTYRVIPAVNSDRIEALLKEIKKVWPNVGDNVLEIEVEPPAEADVPAAAANGRKPVPEKQAAVPSAETQLAKADFDGRREVAQAASRSTAIKEIKTKGPIGDSSITKEVSVRTLPVLITVRSNGQLVLSSRDTAALDLMEDLISRLAASSRSYPVFYLQHASASLVTLNLEEYFEDESEFNEEDNWWRAWNGLGFKESQGTGLGAGRNIRFIWDIDTNSILVVNASPEQLQIVEDLVKMYDLPPSDESFSKRRLKLFALEYAKAEQVAATIKEVFRDLLSSKDKEFDRPGEEKKQESSQSRQIYRIFGGGSDDDDKKPTKVKASFAGALSIGVDPTSNTLIVSAQDEWMESISDMITRLDQRAAPYAPAFQVHRVKPGLNSAALYASLSNLIGEPATKSPPQQEGQQQQPPQPQVPPGENPVARPDR